MNGASISTADYRIGSGSLQLTASSSQYVQIPAFITGSTGLSISLWFRASSCSNYAYLFSFNSGLYTNDIMLQLHSGYPEFVIWINGAWVFQTLSLSMCDNVWRHVTWTLSPDGTWAVYVNGVSFQTSAVQGYVSQGYPYAATRNLNYLGMSQHGGNPYLQGAIDEFRIYNSVLGASDAWALYAGNNKPRASPPTTILLLLLPYVYIPILYTNPLLYYSLSYHMSITILYII